MNSSQITPGTLLIAHPLMKPNLFSKSVVMIIESHNRLYKGLIVNKKSTYYVKDVFGECEHTQTGQSNLYKGGPVNPAAIIMLHSNEWYSSNTMQIGSKLAISSDPTMVEKLSLDNVPFNYKIISGISHWTESQLKNELSSTAEHKPYWLILDNYDPALLFDSSQETTWETAIDLYSQNMFDQFF